MTRAGRVAAALTAALLLGGAAPGPAQQLYAPETMERYFQVDFEVTRNRRGPAVEGYLYNRSRQTAQRVRLEIQRVDTAGAVVGSSGVWVPGEVPMESRVFFTASVSEAASYRVRVQSFDWTCQGGGGM